MKVLEKKYYIQIYRHTLPTAEDSEWVDLESLGIHPDIVQQLLNGAWRYRAVASTSARQFACRN